MTTEFICVVYLHYYKYNFPCIFHIEELFVAIHRKVCPPMIYMLFLMFGMNECVGFNISLDT